MCQNTMRPYPSARKDEFSIHETKHTTKPTRQRNHAVTGCAAATRQLAQHRSAGRSNANRHANAGCSTDATTANGTVRAVDAVPVFADRCAMKRQIVLERIDALSDRQLMLCDFARMALGKRDRKAAEMLVKDAMSVDAELRGLISRLGPVEMIGRI